MSKKKILIVSGAMVSIAILAFAGVMAQEILNPKMAPEKGTFEAPAGKVGVKSKNEWSQTTVAAGVDGKPLPGKMVTLVGEILDFSCYMQLGKHGAKHRDCGQKCLKNGAPIALLTKDGKVYVLIEEEHDPRRDGLTTFRQAAIDNMAYVMEVTGTLSEVAGQRVVFVRGFVKKG
jgi:hypothetical protein